MGARAAAAGAAAASGVLKRGRVQVEAPSIKQEHHAMGSRGLHEEGEKQLEQKKRLLACSNMMGPMAWNGSVEQQQQQEAGCCTGPSIKQEGVSGGGQQQGAATPWCCQGGTRAAAGDNKCHQQHHPLLLHTSTSPEEQQVLPHDGDDMEVVEVKREVELIVISSDDE